MFLNTQNSSVPHQIAVDNGIRKGFTHSLTLWRIVFSLPTFFQFKWLWQVKLDLWRDNAKELIQVVFPWYTGMMNLFLAP